MPKDRQRRLIRRALDIWGSEHLDVGVFHEQDMHALAQSETYFLTGGLLCSNTQMMYTQMYVHIY